LKLNPALNTDDPGKNKATYIRQTENAVSVLFAYDMLPIWLFSADQDTVGKYYDIVDRFGFSDVEALHYWDNNGFVKCSEPDVKVTIYRKAGKAMFVVSNFSQKDAEAILNVNEKSLGILSANVSTYDPVTKERVTVKDGRISLPVPGYGLRVVVWE
jgi:hypothetical protein